MSAKSLEKPTQKESIREKEVTPHLLYTRIYMCGCIGAPYSRCNKYVYVTYRCALCVKVFPLREVFFTVYIAEKAQAGAQVLCMCFATLVAELCDACEKKARAWNRILYTHRCLCPSNLTITQLVIIIEHRYKNVLSK